MGRCRNTNRWTSHIASISSLPCGSDSSGACIGSFLNVVAYRMPLGMSVVWQPSHCPRCKHPIPRVRQRAGARLAVAARKVSRLRRADFAPLCDRRVHHGRDVFRVGIRRTLQLAAQTCRAGPITEMTGAWDLFWNPQWAVIGGSMCLYHCTLLCLLMCVVLIDLDDELTPDGSRHYDHAKHLARDGIGC